MKFLVVIADGLLPVALASELYETARLVEACLGVVPDLVLSQAWFQEKFVQAGSLESWVWSTVSAKDYETREPTFAALIYLPGWPVDRYGVLLGLEALRVRRPIVVRGSQVFREVLGFRSEGMGVWNTKIRESAS